MIRHQVLARLDRENRAAANGQCYAGSSPCIGCFRWTDNFDDVCEYADLDHWREGIQWAMDDYPTLCPDGLVGDRRADLLSETAVKEFIFAIIWVAKFPKIRGYCRKGTSYDLKHVFERATGFYCTNGTFIAAAVTAGLKIRQVEPGSPNAWLNITAGAFTGTH